MADINHAAFDTAWGAMPTIHKIGSTIADLKCINVLCLVYSTHICTQ
jgi:hypothetical protein